MKNYQEYINNTLIDSSSDEETEDDIYIFPTHICKDIYEGIKKLCKDTYLPLFDKLTEQDLMEFLYPDFNEFEEGYIVEKY